MLIDCGTHLSRFPRSSPFLSPTSIDYPSDAGASPLYRRMQISRHNHRVIITYHVLRELNFARARRSVASMGKTRRAAYRVFTLFLFRHHFSVSVSQVYTQFFSSLSLSCDGDCGWSDSKTCPHIVLQLSVVCS